MIGMLVVFNKKCKAADIDLKFRNVTTAVMEVLALARLDEVFAIVDARHGVGLDGEC